MASFHYLITVELFNNLSSQPGGVRGVAEKRLKNIFLKKTYFDFSTIIALTKIAANVADAVRKRDDDAYTKSVILLLKGIEDFHSKLPESANPVSKVFQKKKAAKVKSSSLRATKTRLSVLAAEQLKHIAERSNLSARAVLSRAISGEQIPDHSVALACAQLSKINGLIKHAHIETHGLISPLTAEISSKTQMLIKQLRRLG